MVNFIFKESSTKLIFILSDLIESGVECLFYIYGLNEVGLWQWRFGDAA